MTDNHALVTAALTAVAVIFAAIAVMIVLRGLSARTVEQRVSAYARPGAVATTESKDGPGLGQLQRLLYAIGQAVRARTRMYSEQDIATLEGLIASSGLRPRNVLPILLGLKVVLLVGIPTSVLLYAEAAGLSTRQHFLLPLFSVPVGMLGPDYVIAYLRKPYLASLRRGVPDALDLLVVCTEAGMGLESALDHVSKEMAHSNPAIAQALGRLLDDMRVLPDRRTAFHNFAERTGIEGARRVSSMMAQSVQYGTPLTQALRTVALDLRRERMTALEARAAKLPVMLTLPLILFIMPSLFIVLLGPTLLTLQDTIQRAVRH